MVMATAGTPALATGCIHYYAASFFRHDHRHVRQASLLSASSSFARQRMWAASNFVAHVKSRAGELVADTHRSPKDGHIIRARGIWCKGHGNRTGRGSRS